MNKYIRSINYLISKKTQNIPHNGKSFFQHLVGVYDKLRYWQCNEDICFAGLFHSIYGNEIFKTVIEKDRNTIKDLIGNKAENLVYLFNQNRYQNKQLKIISLANELDQTYIQVIDGYFDNQNILENYFYFRDRVPWNFNGSGNDENKWRKFKYDLNFKSKIEKNLKYNTENILNNLNLFDLLKFERVYASANPFGTVHEPHKDYLKDSKGGITVMYYLNHDWNLKFSGETVFFNNKEIIKSIIPKPGRIVIFDGNIEHCARDVRRDVNDLRMVLTFKYKINL
jgi:hypothetical protein